MRPDRRIFVLSRPTETVWTLRQVFQFCASGLRGCYRPSFGALTAWLDRMLMHTAAALAIRPLLTRLASAVEGTAWAAKWTLISWRRDTRPQAASD
jgi:hypothetical protein